MEEKFGRLLTLPEVARLAEVRYRTLHAWVQREVLVPSIQASRGSGTPNLFTTEDAVRARILGDLRRAGLDLSGLERVAQQLNRPSTAFHGDEILAINGTVKILSEKDELSRAFDRQEPALLYRVSWAQAAVQERSTA